MIEHLKENAVHIVADRGDDATPAQEFAIGTIPTGFVIHAVRSGKKITTPIYMLHLAMPDIDTEYTEIQKLAIVADKLLNRWLDAEKALPSWMIQGDQVKLTAFGIYHDQIKPHLPEEINMMHALGQNPYSDDEDIPYA